MQTGTVQQASRYAKCIEVSKRIRWEIERDVIRGRKFDFSRKFLPDAISKLDRLEFLGADERRLLSQIQGRTYANMFGLVERFISAKMIDVSRGHSLGDQTALEALVRFTDEELKHQELFRRIERLTAEGMPAGYRFVPQPNDVAAFVLGRPVVGAVQHRDGLDLETELAIALADRRAAQLPAVARNLQRIRHQLHDAHQGISRAAASRSAEKSCQWRGT